MVTSKRKKSVRQRGGTTHGWGAMKKHRGAGNRGGVGNAGTGKRGDTNKPSIWKERRLGMYGFKSKSTKPKVVAINVSDISKLKTDKTDINLSDFGINKLLGTGKVNKAYKITVDYASVRAVEKIKEAKGSVTVLKASKEKSSEEKNDKSPDEVSKKAPKSAPEEDSVEN